MIAINPHDRYYADQALKHPFITRDVNIDKIPFTSEDSFKAFMHHKLFINKIS